MLNNDSNSLYLADHWVIGSRLSADLGARYEHVSAESTGDIVSISNNRIVPRPRFAYDVTATATRSSMSPTASTPAATTKRRSAGTARSAIRRSSIPSTGDRRARVTVSPPGSIRRTIRFRPGNSAVTDPTQNVFMTRGTKSPLTHEFSLSYGENLFDGRGYAEVTYVGRMTNGLLDDFLTLDDGPRTSRSTASAPGRSRTSSSEHGRGAPQYQGLVFQSRYRISNNWNVNGHYTLQLKNDGNYEGVLQPAVGEVALGVERLGVVADE